MDEAISRSKKIEFARPSPSGLVHIFDSGTGVGCRYETVKRLSRDGSFSSVAAHYRKISEGLWSMRLGYFFSRDAEVCYPSSMIDGFYELEYFISPCQKVYQADALGRFPLDSQVVLCASAFNRSWMVPAGSRFSTYRFIFTREFLEENFFTDDALVRCSILRQLIDMERPSFNRKVSFEELVLLDDLEHLGTSRQTRMLQVISTKAKVLELFSKYFEIQITSPAPLESRNEFAAAIALMKQSVEDLFPGLEQLAKVSNVSVPTFKRRFKMLFFTTPEKYFRHLQMEEAEEYLRNGTMTIKEVAAYFGFVKHKNFSDCFMRVKGYAPSDVNNNELLQTLL